jgi:hypothetical protein
MFKTVRETELLAGLTLPSNELQFWPFVEIQTFIPWFHIETVEHVGEHAHKGVILAVSAYQLREFVQHDCRTAWIENVQVITPGDLNGTGSWKMARLLKLTEFRAEDGCQLGHVYEVEGGITYSTVITQPSEITQTDVVYLHDAMIPPQ